MSYRAKDASPQQVYAVLHNLVAEYERAGVEAINVEDLKKWLATKKR